ncbi:carboxylating nicotinate-nucleotide diphosphorylase [bacterium]|nr:MAG: carboxylating nicotinate-nucleotide diphosphorylase [bacterium]
MNLKHKQQLIRNALKEDIGRVDITSRILIPPREKLKAEIVLKEDAVIAGLDIAKMIFKTLNKAVVFNAKCMDGSFQKAGKVIVKLQGNARAMLSAERTALNFLSHLSGIATLTEKFVSAALPYKVKIMDTRKTIPGLRELQKYAVRMGGGYNHRGGLWDGVLIKDNHIAASGLRPRALNLGELVRAAQRESPKSLKVEIEVKTLREFKEALGAGPDIIMLDNMKIADIRKAVKIRRVTQGACHKTLLEVSGGVSLNNAREISATGIDIISIGALTHSIKAVDMSLEVIS